jgi:hypothetical protein
MHDKTFVLFGRKRVQLADDPEKLYRPNEDLHKLFFSPNIMMIKLRSKGPEEYIPPTGLIKSTSRILIGRQ